MPRPPLRNIAVFLLISLVSSLLISLARGGIPLLSQLDARLKDLRLTISGVHTPDDRIVIVAIDNKSIKEIGRWPWSRDTTARLIRKAVQCSPRVIALDIVFSEPQNPSADAELARAIAEAGNVVLGHFFRHEPQPLTPRARETLASTALRNVTILPGTSSVPLTSFPAVDANIETIAPAGIDAGFFNQIPDPDGIYRRSLLTILHDGDLHASLSLKGVALYLGGEIETVLDQRGIISLSVGGIGVPAHPDGTLPIPWYGPGGTVKSVSAADLMAGRLDPSTLADRLVFIGFTEKGIYDLRATPFDPAFPGVEIHGTVASAILSQRFIVDTPLVQRSETLLLWGLPLLLTLLLPFLRSGWQGGILLLMTVGMYEAATLILFDRKLVDLSPGFPAASLFLTFIGCEIYRNLVIERQGRYLQKAFASYVAPELVSQLVKNPERLRLGGEKRTISVLFSDIRGFTTLSESLDPERLVTILNRYLTPMTRIVMQEKGMLDKYIGDAIMALFNAPLDIEGHADHACRAALAMIDTLEELNREFAREKFPTLAIGVGIHTGEAVVGNMGAENRFDYTAIGDTVNLASRLEGMTKLYGVPIIISEGTRQNLTSPFHLRELDLVRVKGKSQPVAIHELRPSPYPEMERYRKALDAWQQGEFDQAAALFLGLPDDPVIQLYRNRCAELIASPPATWDGVYTAKEK